MPGSSRPSKLPPTYASPNTSRAEVTQPAHRHPPQLHHPSTATIRIPRNRPTTVIPPSAAKTARCSSLQAPWTAQTAAFRLHRPLSRRMANLLPAQSTRPMLTVCETRSFHKSRPSAPPSTRAVRQHPIQAHREPTLPAPPSNARRSTPILLPEPPRTRPREKTPSPRIVKRADRQHPPTTA
jgi:hypothetical protein